MPVSKAQQRAVSKYMKENYDEIKIRVAKGRRETIKAHADSCGESVNAFIARAIASQMEQDRRSRRDCTTYFGLAANLEKIELRFHNAEVIDYPAPPRVKNLGRILDLVEAEREISTLWLSAAYKSLGKIAAAQLTYSLLPPDASSSETRDILRAVYDFDSQTYMITDAEGHVLATNSATLELQPAAN